jgi:hypothetical protein
MALFRFKTRNPDRDRQTDKDRADRLGALLNQLTIEVEQERVGLRKRLDIQRMDAGFLDESLGNGDAPGIATKRLENLTEAVLQGENRLEVLKNKAAILADLKTRAETLLQ